MFLPASFGFVLALMWVLGGALLGVPLGILGARLIGLSRSRARLDAAMGAAGILAMYGLMAPVLRGARIVDDRTLGWRGILLNHLPLWAIGLVCLAVLGRQLVVARIARRRRHDSPPRVSAIHSD